MYKKIKNNKIIIIFTSSELFIFKICLYFYYEYIISLFILFIHYFTLNYCNVDLDTSASPTPAALFCANIFVN